jgi:hypothetical protein
MRFTHYCLLFTFVILIFTGCSSENRTPIVPNDGNLSVSRSEDTSSTDVWGIWTIQYNRDSLDCSIIPNRDSSSNFNITYMLPTPAIHLNSFDPVESILDVDVTIYNPHMISGYDVRGIVFADSFGHNLKNPDGLTSFIDIPGGDTVNPFMVFAKDQNYRTVTPLSHHTAKFLIQVPPSGYLSYAIIASWPWNCDEPYALENFIQNQGLSNVMGSASLIKIDAYDWQDDVNDVVIKAPGITGEPETHFYNSAGKTWSLILTNNAGVAPGIYRCLIKATSANSGTLGLYKYVDINVLEDSGTEWTFLVYMHESNLGEFAIEDINELEVAGTEEGTLNIVVLWDKEDNPNDVILEIARDPGGYNSTIISPEIDDNGEVIPSGGLDMGSGSTLEKFLRWAIINYPAKNYGLDLWDHGDGPFGIVPQHEFVRSCCNGLSIWEIRDACQVVLNENPAIGEFQFISFDACLMSWIETAICLKDVTYAGIASEMLVPGQGFLYSDPFVYLRDNALTCTTDDFCVQLIQSYVNSAYDGDTLASWRSSDLRDNVIPALNTFSDELTNALSTNRSGITDCVTQAGDWGSYCWDYYVKDLGAFAKKIKAKTSLPSSLKNSADALITEIDNAMIMHSHVGSGGDVCPYQETGWQIWLPEDYDSWVWDSNKADYVKLGMSGTRWDEFLSAFDPS